MFFFMLTLIIMRRNFFGGGADEITNIDSNYDISTSIYGGYLLKPNGEFERDKYEGDQDDSITLEPVNMDQKKTNHVEQQTVL
jgi:hypothetical protein